MRTVGVIIGRFQVASLHGGHVALMNHVLKENDDLCVLVGVAPEITLKNPLPYEVVREVLKRDFGGRNLHVHPLLDIPGEDLQWSMQIDRFLQLLFPSCAVQLYAGRDSFKPHYSGKFQPVTDWYGYDGNVNASQVRHEIINGHPGRSADFAAGVIYGVGNYIKSKEKETHALAK